MNRSDFAGLPLSMALELPWDTVPGLADALADKLVPDRPRPPRFDDRINRKDGVSWASECDVNSPLYWQGREAENAANPKNDHAEFARKRVTALGYWLAWRRVDPYTRWSGKRNGEQVVAEMPSSQPKVYPKPPRKERDPHEPSGPPVDDDFGDDPDIGF